MESETTTGIFDVMHVLATSAVVKYKDEPIAFEANLTGYRKLGLFVLSADGRIDWDHADIINPILLMEDGSELFLGDLKPILASQPYGILSVNKTIDGNMLTINGRTYPIGLGTHAVAEIWYLLPKGAVKIKALGGIDDECLGKGSSKVQFQIVVTDY